jgi:rRNA maturation endonuclease Nob1
MPVDIVWEDGDATVHILCDGCDREYDVLTGDTAGLELCTFCGHYLEVNSESGEVDESEEDSWD